MRSHLDVYVESRTSFLKLHDYKLQFMLRALRRANLTYRLLDRFDATDLSDRAFLHIDLTDVLPGFLAAARHYPACVNGRAQTISRLLYTRARLLLGDAYAGPVIVKTILNHHGWPEMRFNANRTLVRRVAHDVKRRLISDYEGRACPAYTVYPSLADVPSAVWSDQRLMVERFLPGRLDPPIVKHRVDFFYDIELNLRSTHATLLCPAKTVMTSEPVTPVPDEVARVRRALHLDYGSIDYFVIDDAVWVVDANKTVGVEVPWIDRFPFVARHLELVGERLIEFARGGTVV